MEMWMQSMMRGMVRCDDVLTQAAEGRTLYEAGGLAWQWTETCTSADGVC